MGNTAPIFSKVPRAKWVNGVAAANTSKDGTGTVDTVFLAEATNGSFVQKLIARPRGTNLASVLRVFLNDGLGTAAVNSCLIGELTLPATTNSEIAALAAPELPLNIGIPPGYKINVTLGTAVAGGYAVCVLGGDY